MTFRTMAICILLLSLHGAQTSLAREQVLNEEVLTPLGPSQNAAVPIKLFDGTRNSGNLEILGYINGIVIFFAPYPGIGGFTEFGVFASSGQSGITATQIYTGFVQQAITFKNKIYFWVSGGNLVETDGTLSNTNVVYSGLQDFREPTALSNVVVFENNGELWSTDGSLTGTQVLTNVFNFTTVSFLPYAWNGEAYFFATNGISGVQLWRSDGTNPGTVQISNLSSIFGGTAYRGVIGSVVGNELLFAENSDGIIPYLWATDGTFSRTRVIRDVDAMPANFVSSGNTAYFLQVPPPHIVFSPTLKRTDGTVTGTTNIAVDPPNQVIVVPNYAGVLAPIYTGALLFAGNEIASGTELWLNDGVSTGAQLVTDIYSGSNSSSPQMISTGDRVFLNADDGLHGRELWVSDGTVTGTHIVSDLTPGITESIRITHSEMKYLSGKLFFVAYDPIGTEQLWMLQTAPLITSSLPLSVTEPGKPYTHTFATEGWPAPTFEVLSGTLPSGIQLSPTGVLTGTPTTPGTYTITVSVSNGSLPNATQSFVIRVADAATPTPTPTSTLTPTPTPTATVTPIPTATVNPMRPRAYLPLVRR